MRHALLIYTADREDGGMMGFKCALELDEEKTSTFQEAIEFLLPILQSDKFVNKLIEEDCLESDLFTDVEDRQEGDMKLIFCGYRNYGLEYEFEYIGSNADFVGETEVKVKSLDFIMLFDE